MSDIFNIIKANLERSSSKQKPKTSHIDNFLIGEEEINYRNKPRKSKEVDEDEDLGYLDENIASEKTKTSFIKKIRELNLIELDKQPPKVQLKELKKSYLELTGLIQQIEKDYTKNEDELSRKSLELHQIKREIQKTKETLRVIVGMMPDGGKLKERLDTSIWYISEMEEAILTKVKNLVERNKNIDSYVKKELETVLGENKTLKRELVRYQAEMVRMEEHYTQLLSQNTKPQVTPPPTVIEVEEDEEEVPTFKPEPKPKAKPVEKPVQKEKGISGFFADDSDVSDDEEEEDVAPEPEEKKEFKFNFTSELEEAEEVPAGEAEEDDDDGKFHIIDIERYVENLSEANKIIISLIGETGVSRNNEMRPLLETSEEGMKFFGRSGKFSYQDMSATVKQLRDGGFIDNEQIKLGAKGGYNFTCYELTQLGKAVYKNLSGGKKAAVSEKKLIENQHKSLEHGFLIKDCATEFRAMGYTVYDDRADVTVKLPSGAKKVFDLILELDGKKQYIEVERGTHNDEDFFNAMDKIYEVTPEFYFVSPNETQLFGKTKVQFYKWLNERLGGIDKAKGKITVNFATFENIKKRGKTIWKTQKL